MPAVSHLLSQETDELLLLKPHVHVAQEGEGFFFFPQAGFRTGKRMYPGLVSHVLHSTKLCRRDSSQT